MIRLASRRDPRARMSRHGESPRAAWEAVSGAWAPNGAWRKLIERRLRERGIEFDLL